ncbi:ParA family protein [Anaerolineales bacterium HSG6]|nr:ParA family protein [Anaerolineales bacterium HSG6]MDM8530888.1 ParA family protein [Anaerolineales bacterium HSG25]
MRIISVTNLKGGSAKSTTTFNLAGALREAGYRVLCIDIDPQKTLGEAYFGVYAEEKTLSDALINDNMIGELMQASNFDGLYVIPADDGLKAIKSGQTQIEGGELRLRSCLTRVRTHIDQVNGVNKIDWVLIDCPPSLDKLTMNALVASDYVLVPVDPGAGGRGALGDTIQYVSSAQKWYNPTLKLLGLLIGNTDTRTIYDQTVVEVVREIYGDLVFKSIIRASVRVRESAESQTPLTFCKGSEFNRYADMYRGLKDEIVERTA